MLGERFGFDVPPERKRCGAKRRDGKPCTNFVDDDGTCEYHPRGASQRPDDHSESQDAKAVERTIIVQLVTAEDVLRSEKYSKPRRTYSIGIPDLIATAKVDCARVSHPSSPRPRAWVRRGW